jgi:hypothetical protein
MTGNLPAVPDDDAAGNSGRTMGRPAVGRPVKYAMPAAMREAIAAHARPREAEAATVRRLLSVALDPRLAALLDRAAEAGDPAALELGDRLAPAGPDNTADAAPPAA